jgi:hypothetical protein
MDPGPETCHLLSDLTMCNLFLFSSMRNHLKGSQFETMEEIQEVMMAVLK